MQSLDQGTPSVVRWSGTEQSCLPRSACLSKVWKFPYSSTTRPPLNKVKLPPRRSRRRSGVSRRRTRSNRTGARTGTRARRRLGPWESDEPRLSAELVSPSCHRGPARRPARRGRRGGNPWGRARVDWSRARTRTRAGRRLRPGKRDNGWLAADKHTDPNGFGVGCVSRGGFLRGADGVLGFEAFDTLESLGARRTEGVAVHPHRDRSLFEVRSKCDIFFLVLFDLV